MKAQSKTYEVSVKTLTPLHIGSGRELNYNTDYIFFKEKNTLGVVDPEKVLQIIGAENIEKWVAYIRQRKGIDSYITEILKKTLNPADISSRLIPVKGKGLNIQNVKEQLYNGTGKPYLPGSSIKGSLRTALLTQMINEEPEFVAEIDNLQKEKRKQGRISQEFDDSKVNAHYFGDSANNDFMRLLRAGDAYFNETNCQLITTVNLYDDEWRIKDSINQFVECIPAGALSEFNFQLFDYGDLALNLIHKNKDYLFAKDFISKINEHTLTLLANEITFWFKNRDLELIEPYYLSLLELKNIARQLKDKPDECLLRVGFGGGFASMTGDWQYDHLNENDYDELVYSLRSARYEGLQFPKTRKFTGSKQPLGFVHLKFKQK